MSDTLTGRLTGRFRDVAPSDPSIPAVNWGIDPPCEVEVEILSGDLDAGEDPPALVPARLITPDGTSLPWYAAAIVFFGTLNVTITAPALAGTGRTYTVDPTASLQPVTVVLRAERDHSGDLILCLEVTVTSVIRAVVLGKYVPSLGAVDVDDNLDDDDTGPGVIFPGQFCWLMLIAPDGTTYGSIGDTEQGSDDQRVPLGYYGVVDPSTPANAADPTRLDDLRHHHLQALPVWTQVVLTTAYDRDARGISQLGSHAAFWSVAPCDRPDAHILRVFGTLGPPDGPPIDEFKPGKVVVYNETKERWEAASVVGASPTDDVTIRSPLQRIGIALGHNGETGILGEAAVVVWGRFWLNPDVHALEPWTTYFIDPLTNDGSFTASQPEGLPYNRPVFRHIEKGWCVVVTDSPEAHLAWSYADPDTGTIPKPFLAEAVFDRMPAYPEPNLAAPDELDELGEDVGILRWRDRPYDEYDPANYGGLPAPDQLPPIGHRPEQNDMMAWFTAANPHRRALVVKRLEFVFDSSSDPTTMDFPFPELLPDRPGVLGWFYRSGARVTDEWDFGYKSPSGGTASGEANRNFMLRYVPYPGANPEGTGGAILKWEDAGFAIAEWYLHPTLQASGAPFTNLTDFDDNRRKVAWSLRHEYYGRNWEYLWNNGSSWVDGISLRNADFVTPLAAAVAGSRAAAFPLRLREIEICDSSDNVYKIMVICSDMYS
jgi:hypothetical protein